MDLDSRLISDDPLRSHGSLSVLVSYWPSCVRHLRRRTAAIQEYDEICPMLFRKGFDCHLRHGFIITTECYLSTVQQDLFEMIRASVYHGQMMMYCYFSVDAKGFYRLVSAMLNCRLNLLLHQCWDWCCCIQYDAKMVFIAHGNNFDAIPETMSYCCSQIHHHRHGLSDLRNDLKQMLVFFTVNDAVWLDDFQRFLVGGSILVIHWLNCYFQMFDRHQRWELFCCSCLDSLNSPFLRYCLRSLQSRPRVNALENANSTSIDSYSQRMV